LLGAGLVSLSVSLISFLLTLLASACVSTRLIGPWPLVLVGVIF